MLACDHVDQQYRYLTDDYGDLFRQLFEAHGGELELVDYDVVAGDRLPSVDDCDGFLITGSRHSAYDALDWIASLEDFVRRAHDADVPVIGVCFGHQLLAQALGGEVVRAETGWGAGIRRMDVVAEPPWMTPRRPSLDLHFMHQDQVVELPDGATLLGRTDHCCIAMFQLGSAIGMQAHPEFDSPYAAALTKARELRVGPSVAADALATLGRPTDHAVVADWLSRFLALSRRDGAPG